MGSASSSMKRCLKLRMLLMRPDLHSMTETATMHEQLTGQQQ
jgi:hypothetical protein